MNVGELRKALKDGPTLISLRGKEEAFKEEAKKTIIKRFVRLGSEPMNVEVLGRATSLAEARDSVSASPFGSDYRVVFYAGREPDAVAKFKGSRTVLVSMEYPFEGKALQVDCLRLYGAALLQWIRSTATSMDVILDKEDIRNVAYSVGSDIQSLKIFLTKLSLLDHVDSAAVNTLCEEHAGGSLRSLVLHVINGRLAKAMDMLSSPKGHDPMVVAHALHQEFLNLFTQEAGVDLHVSDYDKDRMLELKGRFSTEKLSRTLRMLTSFEFSLRVGEPASLVQLVTRICNER